MGHRINRRTSERRGRTKGGNRSEFKEKRMIRGEEGERDKRV
jgi:hypothetical protein